MALLEMCDRMFGTRNLYDVLMVAKEASKSEVKKGYYKRSLKVHPDRAAVEDKEEATAKFQTLSRVYTVLSDKARRNLYDETGEVDDEVDMDQQKDWDAYWRILFKKVEVKDIKEFEEKYRGSAEEIDDLKAAYIEFEGDMDEILSNVMCSREEDEPRFTKILKGLIKKGEVPVFEEFEKNSKKKQKARQKRAAKEAEEAEELAEELGLNSRGASANGEDAALKALILGKQKSRQQQMDSLFANLEAKYCQPKKAKGKKQKR